MFTVQQYRTIKVAIEISASVGILPSILPQIKVHASMIKSKTFKLNLDNDGMMEVNIKISIII